MKHKLYETAIDFGCPEFKESSFEKTDFFCRRIHFQRLFRVLFFKKMKRPIMSFREKSIAALDNKQKYQIESRTVDGELLTPSICTQTYNHVNNANPGEKWIIFN